MKIKRERDVGEVFIKLKKNLAGGSYLLEIGDTGRGIPKEFETKQSPILGLQFIDLLSKQLSASYHVENSGGTKYEFMFKKIGAGKESNKEELSKGVNTEHS